MGIEQNPLFFEQPDDFRKWLEENHDSQSELWVGYYKKASGVRSVNWPKSVDQALCFGWIDGIRKSIDETRYKIRFTPRKSRSHWSHVNIKKVEDLKKLGLMQPSGLKAFKKREEKRSRKASYEQKNVVLERKYENLFKANKSAWNYFTTQSPTYQKQTIWWIMSARKEETRMSRLDILIKSSEEKQVVPPLRWTKKK